MPAPSTDRSRRLLAAFVAGAGITHFVVPGFFDDLMPTWVPGPARAWTFGSGAVEITAGLLTANRTTASLGARLVLATFVVVYTANVDDALTHPPTDGRGIVSWLRLPLQFPLIWWAWRHARPTNPSRRGVVAPVAS